MGMLQSEIDSIVGKVNRTILFDFSEGSRTLFWTQHRASLTHAVTGELRSPLDALRAGEVDKVVRCAQGYAER